MHELISFHWGVVFWYGGGGVALIVSAACHHLKFTWGQIFWMPDHVRHDGQNFGNFLNCNTVCSPEMTSTLSIHSPAAQIFSGGGV
jgi:hypothetical protein